MSENMDQDWAAAAEIKHGRVCMMACVGYVVQEFVHLPNEMYSESNPLLAMSTIPHAAWAQIIFFIACCELATFKATFSSAGADYNFDPLGMMSKVDVKDMRVREIINGRLAMLGIMGFMAQTLQTGKPVVAQLASF